MNCDETKRVWSLLEDSTLRDLVVKNATKSRSWVDVGKLLSQHTGKMRTGKQCRQRWQHQLNPNILREDFTIQQQLYLYQLQELHGNKWALIAKHMPGRTDNAVKNFFYSSIRRIIKRLNHYLARQRKRRQFKDMGIFKTDFSSKLTAVVDGNQDNLIRPISPNNRALSKEILAKMVCLLTETPVTSEERIIDERLGEERIIDERLGEERIIGERLGEERIDERLGEERIIDERLDVLLLMMSQLRQNCKKRKQKRQVMGDQLDFKGQSEIEDISDKRQSGFIDSCFSSQPASGKIELSNQAHSSVQKQVKIEDNPEEQINEKMNEQKQSVRSHCKAEPLDMAHPASGLEISAVFHSKDIPTEQSIMNVPLLKSCPSMKQQDKDGLQDITHPLSAVNIMFGRERSEIAEEDWNWGDQSVCFPLFISEDSLCPDEVYESRGMVTKLKMLEASLALEQLELNLNKLSSVQHQKANSEC